MRVELGGQAEPRSEFALFAPGSTDSADSLVLVMEDGEVFAPADYISLGYTNFEAWCIGAAGGQGGGLAVAGISLGVWHGGGGGGGGLHRVGGELSDLDAAVLVSVGVAGANGSDHNGVHPYLAELNGDGSIKDPLNLYANPGHVPAQAGEDGAPSSFGDVCHASGGKGGGPIEDLFDWMAYDNTHVSNYGLLQPNLRRQRRGGQGGAGGVGGQVLIEGALIFPDAGYGADGAESAYIGGTGHRWSYENADQGTWDGSIGEGGGGGVGGVYGDPAYFGLSSGYLWHPTGLLVAAKGGRGSFSYADTSVNGPGQGAYFGPHGGYVAGTGGGAKVVQTYKFGSNAPGFNPNGLVLLRLTKVD